MVKGPGKVFADRYFCNLRMNYVSTLSGATSDYRQLAINGAYDPYLGTGGNQPMGYNQLSELYLRYRVHSCKIKIVGVNLTAIPAYVIVYPCSTASVPVSIQNDREQRYSKQTTVGAVSGTGLLKLTSSIATKKIFGEKNIDDTEYVGITANANPVNTAAWNVSAYSSDGSTNLNMPIQIMVEYNIEFFDPVRLAIST